MGLETLSPIHPKNPASHIADASKISGKKTKEKKSYSEGMQNVYLPSKGVFYEGEYKNLDSLKVRPLNYTDEDILTTPSFFEDGTVFIELLKNTIIDENGIKANSLVSIDRDTILLWLRSTSFGNKFDIEYTCPKCGFGNGKKSGPGTLTWMLNELEIPEYPEEIFNELEENGELTVETALSKLRVKIVIPSLSKTLEIEKRLKKKAEDLKEKKQHFATTTLLSVINGIEWEDKVIRAKDEIVKILQEVQLPLSDSRYILREAAKLNLKYNTAKSFTCLDCQHVEEGVELPLLHKNFFWPES